jgi:predicted dienelactone hydrolase
VLRWLLLALSVLAAGVARAEPAVHDLDWFDESRQRAVPVRLYWPEGAARVPLVVFSHGIGGSRQGYSYLGEHFAANGMASLHLQHVGSDRSLWTANLLTLLGKLSDAALEREALERVRDLSFALDQLLAHEGFGARVDRKRIAAAGHSYGANTAMLAAGASVLRGGQPLALRDARVRAAVLLSAPPFYGEGDLKPILRSITLPTLHVTATEDIIRIPGYYSPASDRIAVFDAVGSPLKALAVFQGGSHSIFTNRIGTGGVELNPKVKAATRELALSFLRRVFDGRDEALARWPETYGPLLARWTGSL